MFMILDAGSTKTDVRLVSRDGENVSMELTGINPYFMDASDIRAELELVCSLDDAADVEHVFYYGAGCVAEFEPFFRETLNSFFPHAHVEAYSDLYAACRATLGDGEGIACILGTGSNSCHFDGEKIVKNVSPLGFILGDEGSGAVLGKMLLGDILKGCAPSDVCEMFWQWCGMDRKSMMDGVYRKSFPNRFLASFSRFLGEHIDHAYCRGLVERAFCSFYERNILQYDPTVKRIGFVGSVAYYLSDILQSVSCRYGYQVSTVLQRPMDALEEYYRSRLFTT